MKKQMPVYVTRKNADGWIGTVWLNASREGDLVRLPRKPQYVRVELDADMAPEGPLHGGAWPGRERVLTYHFFGKRKLRAGQRVCVNDGLYKDVFGTVLGRDWRRNGYTYGVRRARLKTITVTVPVEKTTEIEVA